MILPRVYLCIKQVITLKSIMLNCYVRIHFRNNGVVVVDVGAVFGGAWSDCILRGGNFGFGLRCPFGLIGFIVGVGVSTTGNVTRL